MPGELRDQVLEDLSFTIKSDWNQKIELSRNDDSDQQIFDGNTNDIHLLFDPQTGEDISGRRGHAVFTIADVLGFYGELPRLGWIVRFIDLPGPTFRVKDVQPDNTMGVLILVIGK